MARHRDKDRKRDQERKRKHRDQKNRKGRRGAGGEARRADKYALYQEAVQEPICDLLLIQRIFRRRYGHPPRDLREDFCGTAHMACAWVQRSPANRAWGIDIDPEPLDWGRRHNVSRLSAEQQSRLKLVEGDVRSIGHEPVDVTVAFNFSYFLFESREELRHYFSVARSTLRPEGLFFLDAYGGAEAQLTGEETREVDGFDYVWDQHRFDPISHRVLNYIHFEFPDGSRLRRAFRYDWRLWTLQEIRELLLEAGFSEVEIYWEGTDGRTGEGNNVFTKRREAPDDPAWVTYIVAVP